MVKHVCVCVEKEREKTERERRRERRSADLNSSVEKVELELLTRSALEVSFSRQLIAVERLLALQNQPEAWLPHFYIETLSELFFCALAIHSRWFDHKLTFRAQSLLEFQCKMPARLKIRVLGGRSLPVMDKSSDTSDAFVEVKSWVDCLNKQLNFIFALLLQNWPNSGQDRKLVCQNRSMSSFVESGLELGMVQIRSAGRRASGRTASDSHHGLRHVFGQRCDRQSVHQFESAVGQRMRSHNVGLLPNLRYDARHSWRNLLCHQNGTIFGQQSISTNIVRRSIFSFASRTRRISMYRHLGFSWGIGCQRWSGVSMDR